MSSTITTNVKKLSHKAFRALLKKFRRKKKRQLIAQAREKQEQLEREKRESSPNFQAREDEKRRNAELWAEYEERERIRKHKEWLVREEQAQAEFRRKKILKEQEKARKDEERRMMLEELERQNAVAVAAEDKTRTEKARKEDAFQEALSELPEANGPWHNPLAPDDYNNVAQKDVCHFFAKTGVCRFGDRCSRAHFHPEVSCTLLIKGMYTHFSIDQSNRDDYDTDMALEFEESEMYGDFKEFYEDVLPEFRSCGTVVQFKVCCNHEPHLRGNVYVQFMREEEAVEAYKKFNGRYYAGKQLSCEFTNIIKWRSAICGLFASNRCPKGNNCNFLHVFKNPDKEFWASDRDLSNRSNGRRRGDRDDHQIGNSRNSNTSRYSDNHYSSYSRRQSERSSRHHSRSPDSRYGSWRHQSSRKRHHSSDSNNCDDGSSNYSCRRSERTERTKSVKSYSDGRRSRTPHQRGLSRPRSPSPESSEEQSAVHLDKSRKKKKKHRKSKKKKRKRSSSSGSSSSRE